MKKNMGKGNKKVGYPATRITKKGHPGPLKPGQVLNPEGKGGFQDHPELRSNGRWSKETSFSYWLNFFKTLPLEEFKQYKAKHPNLCMAGLIAWTRVAKSIEKLDEFKEVANRTEGMPTQRTELTGADGQAIKIQSVNINNLSKEEQEKFLNIYNKVVSTSIKDDS